MTPANRVWTFMVIGDESLIIEVPGGPPLEHIRGTRTIWKMVGTPAEADAVKAELLTHKLHVQRFCEEETPEQTLLRKQRLGLAD